MEKCYENSDDLSDRVNQIDIKRDSPRIANKELPISAYKNDIIEAVNEHQIVIIQGMTGCGKTTQIPQYILDSGINKKRVIGVTQPRKISAVSMAKRVSRERLGNLGTEVGFEIRFNKKVSAATKIKYMTDGILLNEITTDRDLNDYGVIIIDEAHERSVNSDVIMGLLKKIASKREDLKIIITSATISVEKFSKYFNDAKILTIEGRLYPIEVIYMDYHSDYIKKTISVVQSIHNESEKGDILVFLTGEDEIEECCSSLEGIEGLVIKALCGSLDFDAQQDIFNAVRSFERKVIVATNIAETSITIDGIRFVIDCGYVKQSNYISRRGIDILEAVKISKAQAEQRKGRAGRNDSGWCYRLYSEAMYERFADEATPEIHRKNLSEIYLKLIELRIKPKEFEFIDRPSDDELARSEKELQELSLISIDGKLTGVGKEVAVLPVEPCLGKVIITSISNLCSQDILMIISMISEKFIFKRPYRKRDEADSKKKQFHDPDGDHFTLLNVFKDFKKNYATKNDETKFDKNQKNMKSENTKLNNIARKWCDQYFIDYNVMKTVENVLNQIQGMLTKAGLNFQNNSGGREAVKKSMISGYFKNICVKQHRDSYLRLYGRETLFIHPSSSLFNTSPQIILFHEVRKTTRSYMHGVMRLDELIIKDFKKELKIINYPDRLEDLNEF